MTADRDASSQVARVRRYYERNTRRFRLLGEGGASIHRAVWAPGVTTRHQALHYVDEVILTLLADRERPRVIDLGCGVGGSLVHMASRRRDLVGDGITISPLQARTATELVGRAGLAGRVRVREGDFLARHDELAGGDLVFSIEAFVHGPDPATYFVSAAQLLRPGGLLVVCDDLLTSTGAHAHGQQSRWLEAFRVGWRIGSLVTVDIAARQAEAAGFACVGDDDLTRYLKLRRPRDRAIGAFVAATRPLRPRGEYWQSLVGGDALQRCLAAGLVSYRVIVFRLCGV